EELGGDGVELEVGDRRAGCRRGRRRRRGGRGGGRGGRRTRRRGGRGGRCWRGRRRGGGQGRGRRCRRPCGCRANEGRDERGRDDQGTGAGHGHRGHSRQVAGAVQRTGEVGEQGNTGRGGSRPPVAPHSRDTVPHGPVPAGHRDAHSFGSNVIRLPRPTAFVGRTGWAGPRGPTDACSRIVSVTVESVWPAGVPSSRRGTQPVVPASITPAPLGAT